MKQRLRHQSFFFKNFKNNLKMCSKVLIVVAVLLIIGIVAAQKLPEVVKKLAENKKNLVVVEGGIDVVDYRYCNRNICNKPECRCNFLNRCMFDNYFNLLFIII